MEDLDSVKMCVTVLDTIFQLKKVDPRNSDSVKMLSSTLDYGFASKNWGPFGPKELVRASQTYSFFFDSNDFPRYLKAFPPRQSRSSRHLSGFSSYSSTSNDFDSK